MSRIANFSAFRALLEAPFRVARRIDPIGVEIYVRGYSLAERLRWKDSWFSCRKEEERRIFSPEHFVAHVLIRTTSWDADGQSPLWDSVAAGLPELLNPNEHRGLPGGVQTDLFAAGQMAAGLPPMPVRVDGMGVGVEPRSAPTSAPTPLERLRAAYSKPAWFRQLMPPIQSGNELLMDDWVRAEFRIRPMTTKEYFEDISAIRPVDGGQDRDFALPALISAVLLTEDGVPLIPPGEEEWVWERLPYGAALAIREASAQAAGLTGGEIEFFFKGRGSSERTDGGDN